MVDSQRTAPALMVLIAIALLPRGASAQEAATFGGGAVQPASVATIGSDADPNQFGTNWNIKVIPATEFAPMFSSDLWSRTPSELASNNGGTYYANLDLPPGSEVSQVCQFVFDNHAMFDLSISWSVETMAPDHGSTYTELASAATTGAPGRVLICATPASPVPIRAYADIDGDGTSEYCLYPIQMTVVSSHPDNLHFGPLIVHWRRAVSPAPATALFPNDVPTTHPFFRFIEALGASGITAGCGAGSFCPDNQLTRGEMAVFLSKALGLYWPQ